MKHDGAWLSRAGSHLRSHFMITDMAGRPTALPTLILAAESCDLPTGKPSAHAYAQNVRSAPL